MPELINLSNAYRLAVKSNPEDRITVEVGDTKQPDKFYPQTKLCRWGDSEDTNEVNLSVRLVDDAPLQTAVISEKNGLISWKKGAIKAQFYEQPASGEYPEGGYEFEVILSEKPASNKLQFTIQTKGLDFFPQPPLTEEEIKAGDFRPDNVIGSYAVYHSEKSGEFIGGKNYRSGKAFHIYRPKAIDAVGNWTWCDLNIDTLTGILTVTVDQKFLDTAVYPVIVDPTFGYDTAGGSYTTLSGNAMLGSIFASPAYATAALSLSIYTGTNSIAVKGVIVTHSDLNIISNGVGSVFYTVLNGWATGIFSIIPSLTASTDYLLGVVPISPINLYYDAGDTNQGHLDTSNSCATPTNPTDATHNNNKYSVYVTHADYQFDTSACGTGASNPQTLSYTCGADAKLLVLGIVTGGGTIRAGGAPTYNGVAMTQVDSNRSATETCCELWYLLNPDVGAAHDISVPNTGTKTVYLLASSYRPLTAGNTFAYDTANGAVEVSANPDVTVTTTVNNDVVVAVLGDGYDSKPTGRSHEQIISVDAGSYSYNLQHTIQDSAGDVTMSWTVASDDWCMCVGAWKETAPPVTLVIADATCALTSDNVVLTPILSIAEATCALTSDNVTLTLGVTLIIADAACALTSDNVVLTPILSIAEATCSLTSDAISLVPLLSIADATSAITSDNVVLDYSRVYAVIAASRKTVDWLFRITDNLSNTYNWSTGTVAATDDGLGWNAAHIFKIINFSGITLRRNKSESGIHAPNDVSFSISNSGNTLTAANFKGGVALIAVAITDDTGREIAGTWRFKIKTASPYGQQIDLVCEDHVQQFLQGKYPNTRIVDDIFPHTADSGTDTVCVPEPYGTAYIPLRSVYAVDARYYLLGDPVYTYTISEVRTPSSWSDVPVVFPSGSFSFTQATKADAESVNWRVYQPIVADANGDGVADACGLWRSSGKFLDVPTKFTRSDTATTTNPADIIKQVLKNMGLVDGDLNTASFTTAAATFTAWGLSWNFAFYYKEDRPKVLSKLLAMCHSVLVLGETIELQVLSKTSQMTLSQSEVIKMQEIGLDTFTCTDSLAETVSDSGYVAFVQSGKPQDKMLKILVPTKTTRTIPDSEVIEFPGITSTVTAQVLGQLYYQRKFGKTSDVSFTTKGTCLLLRPDDIVTINHADYGGSYDVLIDEMAINADLSIGFRCVRFGYALDDYTDLAPGAVTIATDTTENVYAPVIQGPDSSDNLTNTITQRVRVSSSATQYILIDGDTPRISVFDTTEKLRIGNLNGFLDYATDLYGFAAGTASSYIKIDPTNGVRISAGITASTIDIGGADATSFHVDVDGNIWAGAATFDINTNPFAVSNAGVLRAASGKIGSWNINTTSIYTGTEDHSGYTANAGDITLYSDGSDASIHAKNFYIDTAGNLTATSVTVTGSLTTAAGSSINGVYIDSLEVSKLLAGTITSKAFTLAVAEGTGSAYFNAGKTSFDNTVAGFILGIDDSAGGNPAKFYIGDSTHYLNWTGADLTATGITITGAISGGTIDIGGADATSFHVDVDGNIWAGAATFDINTNPFAVSNAGVLRAVSGTIGGCVLAATSIGSTTFASGPLGYGWNISNTGTAEFQNVSVRGIIHTSVFEKDTISAVNGMVLVSSADVLASDMTALDASTITITGETTFSANEVIRIKDGTDDEWMLVTNAASAPTYTVTRDLAGSYTADNNPVWKKGTAVVSMGVGTGTKTGFILMDSSSSYSPYIDIYGRNSNTYSDYTLHARLGWLKGITDADVGLSTTDVWGLYSDSVYLKGTIVANSGYIGGTTGWQITTGYILKDGATDADSAGLVPADYPFYAGKKYADRATAPFRVSKAGDLTATSVTITGDMTINTGYIGGSSGWTITSKTITGAADSYIKSGIIEGSTLQTASSGKRFVVSAANNEAYFYGDLGDGSASLAASIGLRTDGSDEIIAYFGTLSMNNTKIAIKALAHSKDAIQAYSYHGDGVSAYSEEGVGVNASSSSGIAVYAATTDGVGVYGYSTNSVGGSFSGGKGAARLVPQGTSAAPSHTADKGTLYVNNSCNLYINTDGSTTWALVGSQS